MENSPDISTGLSLTKDRNTAVGRYPELTAAYPIEATNETPHTSLIEYWSILRRSKGTLIIVTFLGIVLGYLATLPQTPIFQARTSVEIVGLNDSFMNIKQINPVTQTGATSETSDIQTQIKILQSESLVERVTAKLRKPSKLDVAPPPRLGWLSALNLPGPSVKDDAADALRMAVRTLKVKAAGQTRILEITADSTDAPTAATFANALANEFIEQNLESRWKATERTGEWLSRQIDDVRIKLERSEDQLQQYAREAGLVFTQEKSNVSEDKLRQIQQNLTAAEADRVSKQSRFEMANNSPAEALPDILNDAGLREYQTKLTDLKRQIAELSITFTPEHPKVKRVQAQFATLEGAMTRERSAILRRIKNEYEESVRRATLLRAEYGGQARLVTGESEKSIKYNILKREVDSNRQIYEMMLQQLKQASVAAALRASNIRVVDTAKAPSHPYKPNARQNAGFGGVIGLFLGIAFVVLRDRANRTIQQPGDAGFYLNIPELGVIPASKVMTDRRLGFTATAKTDPSSQGSADRVELVTWQQRSSMVAEAFRSTLISILFTGTSGPKPRVIVLTSAGPGEGKSTVASNLAIAIAEIGNRVLLVDADMRKPRVHSIFGIPNSPGLSELLKDRDGLSHQDSIRETSVPGLFVLPSGASTSAAMNLLYGAQFSALMQTLRQQFDTILIDTPPMLQISDARVIGRTADRVILVVRAGKTTRDAAQAALKRFFEDGATVLGSILNDWNPKDSPHGYYGYYSGYASKGYQSYYGHQD